MSLFAEILTPMTLKKDPKFKPQILNQLLNSIQLVTDVEF